MKEINDYFSNADKDLCKGMLHRIYGNSGAWTGEDENLEPGPTPKETRLVCKYYIEEPEIVCDLFNPSWYNNNPGSQFPLTEMEVDGVKVDLDSTYRFETSEEHVVKFTLLDITNVGLGEGFGLFSYMDRLVEVIIPEGIESIPQSCFYADSNLEYVTLPDSLIHIDSEAFMSDNSLESIIIPKNVESIGAVAFSYNSNLRYVTSLNQVPPEIHEDTFQSCSELYGRLYVPEESSGNDGVYYNSTWFSTFSYFFPIKPEDMGDNEIWYKTENGNIIEDIVLSAIKDENENTLTLLSNTYENGYGKLKFSDNVAKIYGNTIIRGNVTPTIILLPSTLTDIYTTTFDGLGDSTFIVSYGTMYRYDWKQGSA